MRKIVILLMIVLVGLAFGCDRLLPKKAPDKKDDQNKIAGKAGGTVAIALNGDIDHLNPIVSRGTNASNIQGMMFLGLLRTDENFRLQKSDYRPCLVKSWRFSEDFLEITLFLEENVKWSDGTPVTAKDVHFSYRMMIDPAVETAARSYLDMVKDCVVKGDFEITFQFKQVYANELEDVNVITPLPSHLFGNVSGEQFNNHPFKDNPTVVNGPFRLKKWDRQQMIELERNPEYSFDPPLLDRVVFRIIPDQTARLTNLKTGDVDIVMQIPPDQVNDFKYNHPDINIVNYSGMSYDMIYWLNTHPLFTDKRVRRALTMAINRRQIVDALLFGFGSECTSPIHPAYEEFYNFRIAPIPYDVEGAKNLLAEAGWQDHDGDGIIDKDGQKFEFKMKTNLGNQRRIDAITMIQADLQRVGIAVAPEVVEFTVYLEQMNDRNYHAALGGMRMGTIFDPTSMWHSKSIIDSYNWFNYSNSRIDELIDTGRRALDRERARETWFELQDILYDDQPATFLYVLDNVDGVNKRINGLKTWPIGLFYNIDEWWVEDSSN